MAGQPCPPRRPWTGGSSLGLGLGLSLSRSKAAGPRGPQPGVAEARDSVGRERDAFQQLATEREAGLVSGETQGVCTGFALLRRRESIRVQLTRRRPRERAGPAHKGSRDAHRHVAASDSVGRKQVCACAGERVGGTGRRLPVRRNVRASPAREVRSLTVPLKVETPFLRFGGTQGKVNT